MSELKKRLQEIDNIMTNEQENTQKEYDEIISNINDLRSTVDNLEMTEVLLSFYFILIKIPIGLFPKTI